MTKPKEKDGVTKYHVNRRVSALESSLLRREGGLLTSRVCAACSARPAHARELLGPADAEGHGHPPRAARRRARDAGRGAGADADGDDAGHADAQLFQYYVPLFVDFAADAD